jgi:hypothetical protein
METTLLSMASARGPCPNWVPPQFKSEALPLEPTLARSSAIAEASFCRFRPSFPHSFAGQICIELTDHAFDIKFRAANSKNRHPIFCNIRFNVMHKNHSLTSK